MKNLKVSVTTRQNGYSLAIDKEEFMYYTPAGLVEGIAIRLGMEEHQGDKAPDGCGSRG